MSALKKMVEKLDNRDRAAHLGYVTYLPELQEILSELSPRVPVAILEDYGAVGDGEIGVTVKIGFALERDQL